MNELLRHQTNVCGVLHAGMPMRVYEQKQWRGTELFRSVHSIWFLMVVDGARLAQPRVKARIRMGMPMSKGFAGVSAAYASLHRPRTLMPILLATAGARSFPLCMSGAGGRVLHGRASPAWTRSSTWVGGRTSGRVMANTQTLPWPVRLSRLL